MATTWFTTSYWTLYPRVLSQLRRLVRNFLCGGSDSTRDTRPRVCWHPVILPRQEGGLGIIDSEMQSAALLSKLIVRGLHLGEEPWKQFMVGVTPGGVEVPRSAFDKEMCRKASLLSEDSQPLIPTGPDRKWRYMWRIGPRPAHTKFKELNAEPVIPEGFPDWVDVMNGWGSKMIAAVEVVAEMAAIGFDLPPETFTGLMFQGPNLLAPTGSDLEKDGKEGTILAGYHYDLNFLTIHGRSRFPGLFIWIKNGQKLEVAVPPGCLLLQTGKQFEWLTGGTCAAGMHEVVVSKRTVQAIESAVQAKRCLWRVSSTVFGHIASDAILQPLGHFANAPDAKKYPAMCAGEYVGAELSEINLKENNKNAI
ncbi:hypothetical protein L7F22_055670 [Adiantum nelumboides]|nr:hypothetical protein [Adiantum nelumboides]